MTLNQLIKEITSLQQKSIVTWKQSGINLSEEGFLRLVEENHRFNFELWHAEDRARRDDKGYEFVFHAKREIDHCNQERNNRMEAIDLWLYEHLKPASHEHCMVHSETPGMIIDRLSILALKAYHMQLQTIREEVSEAHRQSCQSKLQTINLQLSQLEHCLKELVHEIQDKTRTFRVYRQFKMYNDPSLNPELYQSRQDSVHKEG